MLLPVALLLLAVGALVVLWLALSLASRGASLASALPIALKAGMPWLVWAVMLLVMRRMSGGRYHPPVGPQPLSRGRFRLVLVMIFILVVLFTPIPLREAMP